MKDLLGPTEEEILEEDRNKDEIRNGIYGVPKSPNKFKRRVLNIAKESKAKEE